MDNAIDTPFRQPIDTIIASLPDVLTAPQVAAHVNAANGVGIGVTPNANTSYGWKDIIAALRRGKFHSTHIASSSPTVTTTLAGFARSPQG